MARERLSNAFRERYRRRRGERSRPPARPPASHRRTDRHHPTPQQPDFTGSRIFRRRRRRSSSSYSNDYRAKL